MSTDEAEKTEKKGTKAREDEEIDESAPLFDDIDGTDLAYCIIRRLEPLIEEGTLGKLETTSTELDIKERWGGGKYDLQGRDSVGKIAKNKKGKGYRRTITIAGDPKFESRASEAKWLRQQGLEPTRAAPAAGTAAPSFMEFFTLMNAQQEQARTAAAAAHDRQLEVMRVETERREREGRDRDVRLEKERLDREERQRRDDKERDERRAKDLEESRTRDREHQKVMLELLTSKQAAGGDGGGVAMLLEGIKLAKELSGGGGGEDDEDEGGHASAIANAIAEGLKAIPESIRAAKGEPTPTASEDGAPSAGPNDIVLRGPIADQMRDFLKAQKARGKDPEKVLQTAMRVLSKGAAPAPKPAANGKPATPPTAAAPPAAPPAIVPTYTAPEAKPPEA